MNKKIFNYENVRIESQYSQKSHRRLANGIDDWEDAALGQLNIDENAIEDEFMHNYDSRQRLTNAEDQQTQATLSLNKYNKNIQNLRATQSSQGSRETITNLQQVSEGKNETAVRHVKNLQMQKNKRQNRNQSTKQLNEISEEYSQIKFKGAYLANNDKIEKKGNKLAKFMQQTNYSNDLIMDDTIIIRQQNQQDEGRVLNLKIDINKVNDDAEIASSQKVTLKSKISYRSKRSEGMLVHKQTMSERDSSSMDPSSFSSNVNQINAINANLIEAKSKKGCRNKVKRLWAKFVFKPTSAFKVKWDLLIILIALWNSVSIPYDFAFPGNFDSTNWQILDYTTDILFAFDILISFRSAYLDSKTDEYILDTTKIAKNYFKTRFWIDLVATLPMESIAKLIPNLNPKTLKFISMIKLVRLLRLAKIINYLKMSSHFKHGMKIVQLLMMLLLVIHWSASFWYVLVSSSQTWFPPKEQSLDTSVMYVGGQFEIFIELFYYAQLTMSGNDVSPTTSLETFIGALILFVGFTVTGIIVGEFSNLMNQMSKKQTQQNEELDMVTAVMTGLKIPEDLNIRVLDYYENLLSARFVKNPEFYRILNLCLSNAVKLFQTEISIKEMKLFDIHNMNQIEQFAANTHITIFLPGDIIIKQGDLPDCFYFILDGLAEVVLEQKDYKFFDYQRAKIIASNKSNIIQRQQSKQAKKQNQWQSIFKKKDQTPSQTDRYYTDRFNQSNQQSMTQELQNTKKGLISNNIDSDYASFSINNFSLTLHKTENKQALPLIQQKTSNNLAKFADSDRANGLKSDRSSSKIINDNFSVVNELKAGDYFGEISLLTNLRRTCSIFAIDRTSCGVVSKENFKELVNTNADFKNKLTIKINSYKDSYFKFLITMVRNVFAFRTISSKFLRNILYVLREKGALKNTTVLQTGQYSSLTYFIKEGKVKVMVKNCDNNSSKLIHFATLNKGASFNLVGSFLNKPALFDYVVADNEAQFLVLDYEDFKKLTLRSESLDSVVKTVSAAYGKEHIKYDFGRMVFHNITELIRAQKLKAQYEDMDSPGIRGGLSRDQSMFSVGNRSPEMLQLFKAVGKDFNQDSFLRIKQKFWSTTQKFRVQGFQISQMDVLQIIDKNYHRFVGNIVNKKLEEMIYSGVYQYKMKQNIQQIAKDLKDYNSETLRQSPGNAQKGDQQQHVNDFSQYQTTEYQTATSETTKDPQSFNKKQTFQSSGAFSNFETLFNEKEFDMSYKQNEKKVTQIVIKQAQNQQLIDQFYQQLNVGDQVYWQQLTQLENEIQDKLQQYSDLQQKMFFKSDSQQEPSVSQSINGDDNYPETNQNLSKSEGKELEDLFVNGSEGKIINQSIYEENNDTIQDQEASVIQNKSKSSHGKNMNNISAQNANIADLNLSTELKVPRYGLPKHNISPNRVKSYYKNANLSRQQYRNKEGPLTDISDNLSISINASMIDQKLKLNEKTRRDESDFLSLKNLDVKSQQNDYQDQQTGLVKRKIIKKHEQSLISKKPNDTTNQHKDSKASNSKYNINNSLDYSLSEDNQ